MMLLRCFICGKEAKYARKLQDPRRGKGEDIAYVLRYLCSHKCEEEAIDQLERQANYARVAK